MHSPSHYYLGMVIDLEASRNMFGSDLLAVRAEVLPWYLLVPSRKRRGRRLGETPPHLRQPAPHNGGVKGSLTLSLDPERFPARLAAWGVAAKLKITFSIISLPGSHHRLLGFQSSANLVTDDDSNLKM